MSLVERARVWSVPVVVRQDRGCRINSGLWSGADMILLRVLSVQRRGADLQVCGGFSLQDRFDALVKPLEDWRELEKAKVELRVEARRAMVMRPDLMPWDLLDAQQDVVRLIDALEAAIGPKRMDVRGRGDEMVGRSGSEGACPHVDDDVRVRALKERRPFRRLERSLVRVQSRLGASVAVARRTSQDVRELSLRRRPKWAVRYVRVRWGTIGRTGVRCCRQRIRQILCSGQAWRLFVRGSRPLRRGGAEGGEAGRA